MRRAITDSEKPKAHKLFASGATYAEIGRQPQRDPATVKKMVRRYADEPSVPA